MAEIDITIKNYRCFPDEKPVRISLRKGFTAFVGVNNSGKSSLLRFFYEFRNLFSSLSDPGEMINALKGQRRSFSPPQTAADLAELFHNGNERNLELSVELKGIRGNRVSVDYNAFKFEG